MNKLVGLLVISLCSLAQAQTRELSVLTYNVAGLPQEISRVFPERNIPKISPLLNGYDLVLVQEDFAYHSQLTRDLEDYLFRSRKINTGWFGLGDGLSMFSNRAFFDFERTPWEVCSGLFNRSSDCLTPKGFSFARLKISEHERIDVYNLHLDAGRSDEDSAAREQQLEQLMTFFEFHSNANPVIIAGDWNLRRENPRDQRLLERIEQRLKLTSACHHFNCNNESVDKVHFRNGLAFRLTPILRQFEDQRFQDSNGNSLSDHEPLNVVFLIDPI